MPVTSCTRSVARTASSSDIRSSGQALQWPCLEVHHARQAVYRHIGPEYKLEALDDGLDELQLLARCIHADAEESRPRRFSNYLGRYRGRLVWSCGRGRVLDTLCQQGPVLETVLQRDFVESLAVGPAASFAEPLGVAPQVLQVCGRYAVVGSKRGMSCAARIGC